MQIRVLGCSGSIAAGSRTTSFLLDDDVLIDADVTVVAVQDGAAGPDLVLVNDLDRTFAAVALDDRGRDVLLRHIGDLEPLARAVAWTALWTELRTGRLTSRDFVSASMSRIRAFCGVRCCDTTLGGPARAARAAIS